jgi:hypothetical protein
MCNGWARWLSQSYNWKFESGSVLIVDEAQTSYWDEDFWDVIKMIDRSSPFRLVTFACYGSSGGDPSEKTPVKPNWNQVVGLRVIDNDENINVGLLLTQSEFDDFVVKQFPLHYFDDEFLKGVYSMTEGHVGACMDVLDTIQTHEVSPSKPHRIPNQ